MLFDLHVHSNISVCSNLSLDEILSQAQSKGLDGVCITDHNTMAAGQVISEGMQTNGLCVLIGQEYSTSQGDFLLFGPYEDLAPGLSATQILDHVQATGGAAIAAHPFRELRPVQEQIIQSGLCRIIEQENGRNTQKENSRTRDWLKRYSLTPVAGSDAHTLNELGQCPVDFNLPVLSRKDLIRVLNSGQGISVLEASKKCSPAFACCA